MGEGSKETQKALAKRRAWDSRQTALKGKALPKRPTQQVLCPELPSQLARFLPWRSSHCRPYVKNTTSDGRGAAHTSHRCPQPLRPPTTVPRSGPQLATPLHSPCHSSPSAPATTGDGKHTHAEAPPASCQLQLPCLTHHGQVHGL